MVVTAQKIEPELSRRGDIELEFASLARLSPLLDEVAATAEYDDQGYDAT